MTNRGSPADGGAAVPDAVDPAAIARLRGFGGDNLVARMVEIFASTAPGRLDAAHHAASAGDCAGVRAALHSLKSSAGQLGATLLEQACQEGEAEAVRGNAAALPDVVARARRHLQAALRALVPFRQPAEPPP